MAATRSACPAKGSGSSRTSDPDPSARIEAVVHRIRDMSIVKINAITVPRERFDEFAERFASRAGKVEEADGFEAFELLRPNDDRDRCLVVTRWRSEEDFQAWLKSADFAAGHSQHRERGPVGTDSEIWSFDLLELQGPA
jgi:heme oxygenase (mycobilin-producing)